MDGLFSINDILKNSAPEGLYIPEDAQYCTILKDSEGVFFVQPRQGIKEKVTEDYYCDIARYKLRENK